MKFYKYHGAGNDFILLDNRDGSITHLPVQDWCNRHTGIGADGLMLLEQDDSLDFRMVYYNSDGKLSTLCGNGARCITRFAADLGLIQGHTARFTAADGPHEAQLLPDGNIALQMNDVRHVEHNGDDLVLHTGSPHYLMFTDRDPDDYDLIKLAHRVRYSAAYAETGINVNLVEQRSPDALFMRTYERGVENETLSCGTGVTAAALGAHARRHGEEGHHEVHVHTRGGILHVAFDFYQEMYRNIVLTGPAIKVFEGFIAS
jgi:diaminopimelate epimerase